MLPPDAIEHVSKVGRLLAKEAFEDGEGHALLTLADLEGYEAAVECAVVDHC